MWKLRGRDNRIKQWSEYGEFHNIADAAKRILELEDDPNGALFFEILSRLEYQSEKGFYLVASAVWPVSGLGST